MPLRTGSVLRLGKPGLQIKASSAPAFTPSSLTGLQAWYKADAGTSTTTDGVAISQWNDQSGNSRHLTQATGSKQPLYKTNIRNGKPVVRFDGTDDLLAWSSSILGAAPFTVFAVAVWRSAGVKVLFDDLSLNNFTYQDGTSHYIYHDDGMGNVDAGNSTTPASWGVIEIDRPAGGSTVYINGTSRGTSTGTRPAQGWTGVTIGGRGDAAFPADVDVGEFLLYDSSLSAGNRSSVRSYLGARWGITVV